MRLIFLIAFLLFFNISSQCQSEPFDSTSLYFQPTINSNRNMFHEYWDVSTGYELTVRTKFYLGQLELGTLINNNSSNFETQPDYYSMFSYLGWGYKFQINNRFSNYSGMRLGNYYMSFDDPDIHAELKSENEMGVGLVTSFQFNFNNKWSAILSGEYLKVYTFNRIHLSFISFGIGYSFESPDWFRRFFK